MSRRILKSLIVLLDCALVSGVAFSSLSYSSYQEKEAMRAENNSTGSSSSSSSFWGENDYSSDDLVNSDFVKVMKKLINDNTLQITTGTASIQSQTHKEENPFKLFLNNMYLHIDVEKDNKVSPTLFGEMGINCDGGSTPNETFNYRYQNRLLSFQSSRYNSGTALTVESPTFSSTLDELKSVAGTKKYVENSDLSLVPDINVTELINLLIEATNATTAETVYSPADKTKIESYVFTTALKSLSLMKGSVTLNDLKLKVTANAAHDLTGLSVDNVEIVTKRDIGTETKEARLRMSFKLNIASTLPADWDELSEEDKEKYEKYQTLDEFILGAGNLPKDVDLFALNLQASVLSKSGNEEYTSTDLNGNFEISTGLKEHEFDADEVKGYGELVLEEPKKGTYDSASGTFKAASSSDNHKFEFAYEVPDNVSEDNKYKGVVTAEYRDKMHVKLEAQSIYEVLESIKGIDDTNLLYPYIRSLQAGMNKLPLMEYIDEGKFGNIEKELIKWLDVKDISENEKSITVKTGASMFDRDFAIGLNDERDDSFTFTVKKINESWGVTEGKVIAYTKDGNDVKKIQAQISLVPLERKEGEDELAFNGENSSLLSTGLVTENGRQYRSYRFSSMDKEDRIELYDKASAADFISMDYLPLFVKCGINTTEKHFFYLDGELEVKTRFIVDIGVKMHMHAEIRIREDGDNKGKVQAYLAFNEGGKTDQKSKDFYSTEYFIDEVSMPDGGAYIRNVDNENHMSWFRNYTKVVSKVFKISKDEILANMLYYILDLTLHIRGITGGGKMLKEVYKSVYFSSPSSSDALQKNYEEWLKSTSYDESSYTFTLALALSKMLKVNAISFKDIVIKVTTTGGDDPVLSSLSVGAEDGGSSIADIIGILSLKASLNATSRQQQKNGAELNSNMTVFNDFVSSYLSSQESEARLSNYFAVKVDSDGNVSNNGNFVETTVDKRNVSDSDVSSWKFFHLSNDNDLDF